jgi:hypothetical protein
MMQWTAGLLLACCVTLLVCIVAIVRILIRR